MAAEPTAQPTIEVALSDKSNAVDLDRRVTARIRSAIAGSPSEKFISLASPRVFRSLLHEPRPVHRVAVSATCLSETAVTSGCGPCVSCRVFDGLSSHGRVEIAPNGSISYLLRTTDLEYVRSPSHYVTDVPRGSIPSELRVAELALNAAHAKLPAALRAENNIDVVTKLTVASVLLLQAAVDITVSEQVREVPDGS